MLKLARMGVVITPPVPAFYNHPESIDDLVDHTVARILDLFDVHVGESGRWTGDMAVGARARIVAARKTAAAVKKTALPRASRRSRRAPGR
jgi:flavoprotein